MRKYKGMQRILSVMLCVMLVFGKVPINAFATEMDTENENVQTQEMQETQERQGSKGSGNEESALEEKLEGTEEKIKKETEENFQEKNTVEIDTKKTEAPSLTKMQADETNETNETDEINKASSENISSENAEAEQAVSDSSKPEISGSRQAKTEDTDKISIKIDRTYLCVGEEIKINGTENCKIKWFVDDEFVADGTYTPQKEDYEKWIRAEAYINDTEIEDNNTEPADENAESADQDNTSTPVCSDSVYFSKLPVIYINTGQTVRKLDMT